MNEFRKLITVLLAACMLISMIGVASMEPTVISEEEFEAPLIYTEDPVEEIVIELGGEDDALDAKEEQTLEPPMDEVEDDVCYAYAKAANEVVNIYAAIDDTNAFASVAKDAVVLVIDASDNARSYVALFNGIENVTGYINVEDLCIMSDDEVEAYIDAIIQGEVSVIDDNYDYPLGAVEVVDLTVQPEDSTGEAEGSTGEDEGSTGEDEGSTGEGEGSTGEGEGSAGEGEGSAGEGEGSTGEDEGSAGEDEGSTGEGEGSTGEDEGSTGEDEGSTGEDEGSTGEAEGSTGEDEGSTGEDESSIGEVEGSIGEEEGSDDEGENPIEAMGIAMYKTGPEGNGETGGVTITQQPTDIRTPANVNVTFSVLAEGEGELSYQWEWSNGVKWYAMSSANAKVRNYTFKATDAVNGRKYRCVVTDSLGRFDTSDEVTLTITNPPVITQQPTDISTPANVKVTFSVLAEGEGDLGYQWEWGNGTKWYAMSSANAKLPDYTFKATDAVNGRKYRCIVTDANGGTATSDEVTLTIVSANPPVITQQPTDINTAANVTVTFSVLAEGEGELGYQWEWGNGTKWYAMSSANAKVRNYTFKATDAVNGRKYRCVVTDANGLTATSDEVTLTIVSANPPTITQQPTDISTPANVTVTFSVLAEGEGELGYQWEWSNGVKWYAMSSANAKLPNYTFKATDAVNGRKYRCVVTDSIGRTATSDEVTLTIVTVNPPTITQQPTDIKTPANVNVTFSVLAEGEGELSYQWEWGNGTKWYAMSSANAKLPDYTFKATDAVNGRKYRCIVTDANGLTATSDEVTLTIVTTNSPVITQQPTDINTPADVIVTFSVVAEEGEGELGYQWEWSNGTKWYAMSSANAKLPNYTFKATDAVNGRKYRCIVTDTIGRTATSDEVTLTIITTNPPVITLQPTDITTPAGVYVTFSVEAEEGEGDLSYQWEWGNGTKWYAMSSANAKLPNYTFKATDAVNGRMYRCIVTDSIGLFDTSHEVTLTIIEVDPPEITLQPTSVTTAAGKEVTFSVEAEGEGDLSYQWEWKDGTTWTAIDSEEAQDADYTFTATDDLDGRKYRCVVKDMYGQPTNSNVVTLTIMNEIIVGNIKYQRVDETMAVIGYEGDYSTYTVEKTVDGTTVTIIGEEAFMDNTNLVSIDLPDTIEIIGARAFKGCVNLSSMS